MASRIVIGCKLQRLNLPSLELRRLHLDLVFCYKIVFGIVHINSDDLFTFSTVAHTRGHGYNLHGVSSVRRNFFNERIINAWNFLPHTVDVSSLSKFKRSLNRVDFSAFLRYA